MFKEKKESDGTSGAESQRGLTWALHGLESGTERNGLQRAGSSGPGRRGNESEVCGRESHDGSLRGAYLGVCRCVCGVLSVIRNQIRARQDLGCKKTKEPQAEVRRKRRKISSQ